MREENHNIDIIKDFIIDNFLFGDVSKLNNETPLLDRGIIDSTGILELVAFLEDNFNIIVKDDELIQENFYSPIVILNYLESKTKSVSAA